MNFIDEIKKITKSAQIGSYNEIKSEIIDKIRDGAALGRNKTVYETNKQISTANLKNIANYFEVEGFKVSYKIVYVGITETKTVQFIISWT